MTEGRNEDEWRKRLTAKLRTSESVSNAFSDVETLDAHRSVEIATETSYDEWVLAEKSCFLSEWGQAVISEETR